MPFRFPLSDVSLTRSLEKKEVENPFNEDGFYKLNQDEFSVEVAEIGSFFAFGGNYVRVVPYPGVSEANHYLYLNGSVYGAFLHELVGAGKLTALRIEIYRLEYLLGMPENESIFFPQLASICKKVKVTKVVRPRDIPIADTKEKLTKYLQSL